MDSFPQPQIKETDAPNSPQLNKQGKVTRKAITSASQAYNIAVRFETNNQKRNDLDAITLQKYNGGQPYQNNALKAAGEDWRSNASTGFMSGIIDRIVPQPIQAIDAARYLTSATLKNYGLDKEATRKTEYFRTEVTDTIRSWDGWKDFLAGLFQEDVLIGRVAAVNLHPYSPWPKVFRGNEIFFDEGIGQTAKRVPCFVAKEDLLVHEFADFIEDGREVAEAAGWNFDNCISAINKALPKAQNSSTATGIGQDARTYEDTIREANAGASYGGAATIQIYNVLAVEPDTKRVTHFIVDRNGAHNELFSKTERFENMQSILTLFTLQAGNGKYYNSRGVGRLLLNLHISIERARNLALDNLNMGGMKILKLPTSTAPAVQFKVMSPFVAVTTDGEFEEKGITANVKDFIEADNQIARWAEQLVGSYISGLRGDDSPTRTATESQIDAQRDAQAANAFLSRLWGQFGDLLSQIIPKLCDPETTDELAKAMQKRLKDENLGGLTDEDIKELSSAPAVKIVQDLTGAENQKVIASYELFRGDLDVDQYKLKRRVATALVNCTFADDILLTEKGVQTREIEDMRQQIGETEDILTGASVPVSPRDNHVVHLKVIFSDLKAAIPVMAQRMQADPSILDHLNAQLVHSKAHITALRESGAVPKMVKPFEDAQRAFEDLLQQAGSQMLEQRKQQSQEAAQASQMGPQGPQQPGMGGEQPGADKEPMAPSGAMSEKIVTAWIAQYENLPDPERSRLEEISGLSIPEPVVRGVGMKGEGIRPLNPRQAARFFPKPTPPPPPTGPAPSPEPIEEASGSAV